MKTTRGAPPRPRCSVLPFWRDLTNGRSHVADGFYTEDQCYLLLAPNARPRRPLPTRRQTILEAVLRGLPQKGIAIHQRLAASTIALHAKLALEALGVTDRPSRAHPLLMRMARSASKPAEARCTSWLVNGGSELSVLSMPRPEGALKSLLPCAEFEVIRGLVQGLSYEDIALRRDISARTVANQISAVFRRLGVSGRNALLERLFLEQERARAAKKSRAEA
ncbi:MAG: helix-turn-helix transcriptional regulator [Polyangiaceae bacterium]